VRFIDLGPLSMGPRLGNGGNATLTVWAGTPHGAQLAPGLGPNLHVARKCLQWKQIIPLKLRLERI